LFAGEENLACVGIHQRRQGYDKAFTLFEQAIKKNSEDMLAQYQLGRASAISGQKLDRAKSA